MSFSIFFLPPCLWWCPLAFLRLFRMVSMLEKRESLAFVLHTPLIVRLIKPNWNCSIGNMPKSDNECEKNCPLTLQLHQQPKNGKERRKATKLKMPSSISPRQFSRCAVVYLRSVCAPAMIISIWTLIYAAMFASQRSRFARKFPVRWLEQRCRWQQVKCKYFIGWSQNGLVTT